MSTVAPSPTGQAASRGDATTQALRGSVRRMLEEAGYQALTIEGVAARSGVAKTSIYCRWPSKAEMVFDLMLYSSDELPPVEDQGSLAGDIDVLAGRFVVLVAGPLGRRIFPGLIGDAAGDPALLSVFETRSSWMDANRSCRCSSARYAEVNWLTRRRSQISRQCSLGRC